MDSVVSTLSVIRANILMTKILVENIVNRIRPPAMNFPDKLHESTDSPELEGNRRILSDRIIFVHFQYYRELCGKLKSCSMNLDSGVFVLSDNIASCPPPLDGVFRCTNNSFLIT